MRRILMVMAILEHQVQLLNSMKGILVILLFIGIVSCSKSGDLVWVNVDENNITDSRGIVRLNGQPLSGVLYKLYNNSDTEYVKTYKEGKRHGESRGWYENASPKYIYHYIGDVFEGEAKEWFPNGNVYRVFNYKNGQEEGMQTMYWADGKLRANYESKNGRKYGLTGIKNCTSPWSDSLKQLLIASGM